MPRRAHTPRQNSRRQAGQPLPATAWQLQTAKAQFSELFRRARTEGPQRVLRQGKEAVVVIAEEEYQRLARTSKQPQDIVEFFQKSPLAGLEIDLEREPDYGRDIDL